MSAQSVPTQQILTNASKLIQENKKDLAAFALIPVVCAEWTNVEAWWLLANTMPTPPTQLPLLQRVLQLRASHAQAQQKLDSLGEIAPALTPIPDRLKQATELVKTKQTFEAIQVILPILCEDENQASAWWLLANTIPALENRTCMVEKVLALRPDHELAGKMMQKINDLRPADPYLVEDPYLSPSEPASPIYDKPSTGSGRGSSNNVESQSSSTTSDKTSSQLIKLVKKEEVVVSQAPESDPRNRTKGDGKPAPAAEQSTSAATISNEELRSKDLPDVYIELIEEGISATERNDFDHALVCFTAAINYDPNIPYAYGLRAGVYEKLNHHARAEADTDKYIEKGGELDANFREFFAYYRPAFFWLILSGIVLAGWFLAATEISAVLGALGINIMVLGGIYRIAVQLYRRELVWIAGGCQDLLWGLLFRVMFECVLWPPVLALKQGWFLFKRWGDWKVGKAWINLLTHEPSRMA